METTPLAPLTAHWSWILLWCCIVAGLVVGLTQPAKWLLFKSKRAPFRKAWKAADNNGTAAKRHMAKVQLLGPVLLLLGICIGPPVVLAADIVTDPVLAVAFGAGIGVFSSPMYDVALRFLSGLDPQTLFIQIKGLRGPARDPDETGKDDTTTTIEAPALPKDPDDDP